MQHDQGSHHIRIPVAQTYLPCIEFNTLRTIFQTFCGTFCWRFCANMTLANTQISLPPSIGRRTSKAAKFDFISLHTLRSTDWSSSWQSVSTPPTHAGYTTASQAQHPSVLDSMMSPCPSDGPLTILHASIFIHQLVTIDDFAVHFDPMPGR